MQLFSLSGRKRRPFNYFALFRLDDFSIHSPTGKRLFPRLPHLQPPAFYCRRCEAIVSEKTAPATPETRFSRSDTKVRELLRSGQRPPAEITRPEVADVLIQALRDEDRERDASLTKDI
jgi:hypothetical protein